jgi:hypothetical protein
MAKRPATPISSTTSTSLPKRLSFLFGELLVYSGRAVGELNIFYYFYTQQKIQSFKITFFHARE